LNELELPPLGPLDWLDPDLEELDDELDDSSTYFQRTPLAT
jgi:hypothetical protein